MPIDGQSTSPGNGYACRFDSPRGVTARKSLEVLGGAVFTRTPPTSLVQPCTWTLPSSTGFVGGEKNTLQFNGGTRPKKLTSEIRSGGACPSPLSMTVNPTRDPLTKNGGVSWPMNVTV